MKHILKDLPAAWGKPMAGAKPAAPAYGEEMMPGVPKKNKKQKTRYWRVLHTQHIKDLRQG